MKKVIILIFAALVLAACSEKPERVKPGAEVLMGEEFDLIRGKNVGLVVNHTSVLPDGKLFLDAVSENPDVNLKAIFAPEHGVRGDTSGNMDDTIDEKTGVPIYSIYGTVRKPQPEQLVGLDYLIFDIQDVGAKFYTYISTLGNVMSAAAENDVTIIVLDRPNPIGGIKYEGWVTDDTMHSFVAYGKFPIMHGMTVGELAQMYNGEGMLDSGVVADLKVVKMKNWKRNMYYDETGLEWIKPSPNMPYLSTAIVYPGTCFFEGIRATEGRGTDKPFEYLGAPWADSEQLVEILDSAKLPGVKFSPVGFTPVTPAGQTVPPKFVGEKCNGVYAEVTDRDSFQPVKTGVYLVGAFRDTYPDSTGFTYEGGRLDRLAGTVRFREMLVQGSSPEEINASWEKELAEFGKVREKYLLY